jgi:hypothetical protein
MAKNSEKEGKAMGKGQFANMPQEVMMKAYPKASEFGPTDLDDTMSEIDRVNKASGSKARSKMSNQH